MRLISIVASQPIENQWDSNLIMYCMETNYSHVSWIFWDRSRSKPRYYEATLLGGVTFTGKQFWEGRNQTIFRKDFEVSDEQYEVFLDEAMDRCGEKYSLLQNLGIQIAKWFKLTRNIFSNKNDGSNCSELIFKFKDMIGLQVDSDQDLITPRDVVESLKRLP